LFIYPGIAAVFVALLSTAGNPDRGVYAMIALLILISIYDLWAVWHSGIMQKMAKYQIDKLKIFAGFLIPEISNQVKLKMQKMKELKKKNKNKKIKEIKINIALLGGGDVVFPLIMAGVVLRKFGFTKFLGMQLPVASLLIVLGSTLGLTYLLVFGKRKKPYPAMPFISTGVFIALGACYLLLG
jgi:presenilin-like A22 family membrane protease